MKKTIAILLLVLVTGVVFADYDAVATPAKIEIYSNVLGLLEHKITEGQVTTSSQFVDASIVESKEIDLSSTTAQTIGYYSMRTNTKSIIRVRVGIEPLTTKIGDNPAYYIPYWLQVGATGKHWLNTQPAGTTKLDPIGVIIVNPAQGPLSGINVYTQGMRLMSDPITVTFSEDYTLTALEGTYSANITFEVTTS